MNCHGRGGQLKIVITGGAGFIGRQLAKALLDRDVLLATDGEPASIDKLVVTDLVAPAPEISDDPRLEVRPGDISNPRVRTRSDRRRHGMRVPPGRGGQRWRGGRFRSRYAGSISTVAGRCWKPFAACPGPRVWVFASSVAVFGGDMPEVIEDDTALTPQTSYGIQKAVTELLINDYSRKGFLDGRSLRLPTVVVRPGKPNKAASSFASSIVREPLQGRETVCPVAPTTGVWILSPRRVVESFIHAAELAADAWGPNRALALPGITVSVAEMVDALGRVAGAGVTERIDWRPDPYIEKIVYGWATRFAPLRARSMGFRADDSIDEIIRAFIDDELGGQWVS